MVEFSNMKKIIISIIIVVLGFFLWAPWMNNSWCKQKIIGYKFDSYESVNDSWRITETWIPFGRKVGARLPESKAPSPGTIGGWGFEIFMLFSGNIYSVAGR